LSSDSPQTSFAGNKTLWLDALTVPRSRQLLAPLAPLRRRAATGVSTPQNHFLCWPSCCVPMSDFVRRNDRRRVPVLGKSGFPRALPKESTFKPHSTPRQPLPSHGSIRTGPPPGLSFSHRPNPAGPLPIEF
jgi:hypothetical protein